MKRILPLLLGFVFLYSCKKTATTIDPTALPNSYSDQQLGASANDMLSYNKYTSLAIEVQYMPGYALDAACITNVTNYLNSLCNKPGGITINQIQIGANGDTLNVDKVAIIEKQNRTAYTSGATLALYILVTDGYDTSVNTLGFAYRNTSICLFGKDIFNNSGGVGEVTRVNLETSVIEHELGHILGLVNLGSPMQVFHQDTVHGKHCNNTKCLMYYAIETHGAFGMLAPNNVPVLDSNCKNDLKANGGK